MTSVRIASTCGQAARAPWRTVSRSRFSVRTPQTTSFRSTRTNPSSRSSRAKASLAAVPKLKPNEPCTCGSGKKYKKCCM
mmetsp:Transcript_28302/g.60827  ORF Transcript_28302/g.60827 Transcript_28302/m.60827 type:complete len:80 (+) Transcript_28302:350-589(+)